MRKIILNGTQIMNFEFQIDRMEQTHFHQSIEIMYVLEGNPEVTVYNTTYQAHPEDIIVINANKKHSYRCKEDVLIGCFEIDFRLLCEMLDTNQLLFWCNSIASKNAAYDDMRHVMKQIFAQYYERESGGKIVLQSLYYKLLQILVGNFIIRSDDKRFEEQNNSEENRISEIINYIHANYQRKISLGELADYLYLSVPYLSKYIKRNLGMNFLDYVNNIRLFHAVDDLLYTSQSVMTIALENGFANTAAFNDVFKKAYNMTPSEYRNQMNIADKNIDTVEQDSQKRIVEKRINEYMENQDLSDSFGNRRNDDFIILDVQQREEYDPYWRRMINLGVTSDLLRSDVQEQVLMLTKELGFQYIRLWDLFGEKLLLNETSKTGEYHFGTLDKILDFLTENGIRPYLELGYKPHNIHETLQKMVVHKEHVIPFGGQDSYSRFLSAFAVHLVNRYGLEEVENWYFEQWCGEDFGADQKINDTFFAVYEQLYQIMKKHSEKIRVGGGGIGIQYGNENLTNLIKRWEQSKCHPDFLSLYCYPYVRGAEDGVAFARQSSDREFLTNQLEMAEGVVRNSGLKDVEIHVTEWSNTISNRNILNDSCFKGAYIVQNVIDCFGKTNILGYWVGLDIFAEYKDTHDILFGGCGLLTAQGIKKPAYYAYRFLNQLGKYLIHRDEYGIVTTNGNNNYSLVCHNYHHLNYKY
ncbi:MAG: helix-turn-helix domain-containing protein, partial [Blautia sp.]|nr:helix-turn-helix domain-containing protein [Blautia sp.]